MVGMPGLIVPCQRHLCVTALIVVLCAVIGEGVDDPDAEEIQQLRKRLHDEEVRAEIAGYASVTAIQNATRQAEARKAAEAALAQARPGLDEARASLAKAHRKVTDLEAQLATLRQEAQKANSSVQASSQRASDASIQIREAQAAQAKAEARAKLADARAAQEEKEAEAARNAAKVLTHNVSQKEAALKAAAKDAQSRGSEAQVSMGDFALLSFLRTCPYQPILGIVLGIAGLYSVVDGELFFQAFFVSTFAAAAGACCYAESSAFTGHLGTIADAVVGAEAALVTGVACYYGMDGFQIIAGALLGLVIAYGTCQYFIAYTQPNKLTEIAWYTVAALIGAISMVVGGRHANAVAGPLAGGLLFASFTVYFGAFVVASQTAATAKFLDFVEALLTGRGVIAMFGQQEKAVWIGGACVWTVVFGLGISRHFCGWPGRTRSSDDDNRSQALKGTRYDRTEPLLPAPHGYNAEEPLPSGRNSGRSRQRSAEKAERKSRKEQENLYGRVGAF